MKTILVATDFSSAALNAARYAADLAIASNADLVLFHVYDLPIMFMEVPLPITTDQMQADSEQELDRLRTDLNKRSGDILNISIQSRTGTFFSALTEICDLLHPVYVILGSQGTTAAERAILGGHTVNAMRHLAWPVIAVPAGITFSSVQKIALACDFKHILDIMPVDEIKILVSDFNARLFVINTGKKGEFDPDIVFGSKLLEQKLFPIKPQYAFVNGNNSDKALLEFIAKNKIDLLIVLPRQHGLMDNIFHSKHTKKFVLHSQVPVLAFHH